MFMLPTLKLNIERWKYNPHFELWVSNMGHIRNRDKKDIAPKVMNNGYMSVKVHGSLNRHMLLHRVVMLTWKPTPEAEKLTVDHLDHNKRNNAVSNLEWVTEMENKSRARRDFLNVSKVVGVGEIILVEDKKKTKQKVEVATKTRRIMSGIAVSNKNLKVARTVFPIDLNEFNDFMKQFYGKVSDLKKEDIDKIISNIITGVNSTGKKKRCGFTFEAEYTICVDEI